MRGTGTTRNAPSSAARHRARVARAEFLRQTERRVPAERDETRERTGRRLRRERVGERRAVAVADDERIGVGREAFVTLDPVRDFLDMTRPDTSICRQRPASFLRYVGRSMPTTNAPFDASAAES